MKSNHLTAPQNPTSTKLAQAIFGQGDRSSAGVIDPEGPPPLELLPDSDALGSLSVGDRSKTKGMFLGPPSSALSHILFGWEGSPKIDYRKKLSWYPYSNLSTGGPRFVLLPQTLPKLPLKNVWGDSVPGAMGRERGNGPDRDSLGNHMQIYRGHSDISPLSTSKLFSWTLKLPINMGHCSTQWAGFPC